jgi:AbiV family abortive infection protein
MIYFKMMRGDKQHMKQYTLNELGIAYIKIFNNARDLLEEAKLLFEHNRYARSYLLSQIAGEELSKLIMVYNVACDLCWNREVDWKEFDKNLRSHIKKNRFNIMGLRMLSRLLHGVDVSDVVPYKEVSKIAETMNYAKNASLYSGEHEGNFVAPCDLYNIESAKSIMSLNNKLYNFFSLVPIQDANEFVRIISSKDTRGFVIDFFNDISNTSQNGQIK